MHRIESIGAWIPQRIARDDVDQLIAQPTLLQPSTLQDIDSIAEQTDLRSGFSSALAFSATSELSALNSPLSSFLQGAQNAVSALAGTNESQPPAAMTASEAAPTPLPGGTAAVGIAALTNAALLRQILAGDRWYPQALLAALGALNHDRHNVLKLLTESDSPRS